jgi:hypothetical protein
MLRRIILVCGIGLVALVGCRRDNTPDSKYAHVMKYDSNGPSYLPVRVPDRKSDSTLLGPPAAAEAASTGEKREKAGEAGKIDDSSAEAAAKSFVAIVIAGDLQQLPKILVAEQAEVVGKMIEGLAPLTDAAKELKAALDEKFPNHDIAGFFPIAPKLGDMMGSTTAFEKVDAGSSDDEQEATIATGPDGSNKIKLAVKKADQAWRVVLPDFTVPADPDAAAKPEPEKIEAFKDITRRVKADELKDVDAARVAVSAAVAGKYKPAPAKAPPTPAPKAEAPKAAPPPPKQEPRSDVDDVVSSPVLPRRR